MNKTILKLPFVSVIVACRNEERSIKQCLKSLLSQDYPRDKTEILVIDGLSTDETLSTIKNLIARYPRLKLGANSKQITAAAFNLGIKQAKGDLVVLTGAHSIYPANYISQCVKASIKYQTDNVGGILKTKPSANNLMAQAIALALSHPFGSGNAYFRLGSKKPRWVDTVFGGCYQKKVFKKIGLFNERLQRSQDLEFNLRLKRAGGKILLAPEIFSYYYPKANLKDFLKHNFQDGLWAIYPLKFVKMAFGWRHYLPLIFILALLVIGLLGLVSSKLCWLFLIMLGSYYFINLYLSIQIAFKQKNIKYLFLMPLVFTSRHFAYGFGSIWGLVKLFMSSSNKPSQSHRFKNYDCCC